MIQQVNLYQVEETTTHLVLPFWQILQLAGAFLLFLVLISGYMFFSHYSTQTKLIALQDKQHLLSEGLTKAQGKISSAEEKEKLIKEIEKLEKMKGIMQKMYNTLTQLHYGATQGFAEYLAALAKYSVADLWLTKLRISSGGAFVTLEGKTTDSKSVPTLIQQLGADPAFAEKSFETFRLTADENDKLMQFTISSDI